MNIEILESSFLHGDCVYYMDESCGTDLLFICYSYTVRMFFNLLDYSYRSLLSTIYVLLQCVFFLRVVNAKSVHVVTILIFNMTF